MILAVAFLAAASLPPRAPTADRWNVAIQPEEPSGYADNPSTLLTPMRQDLTSASLVLDAEGRFSLELGAGDQAVRLEKAEFGLLVPRVSPLAGKEPSLVAYAALQREFNRNETRFGAVSGADEFRVANNCLKGGLWEVMLDKKNDKGTAMFFHGWFSFPKDAYARAFDRVNGVPYADCSKVMEEYPKIDGLPAPLEKLRTVEKETAGLKVATFLDEAVVRFGEQKRKAKLLLNAGIATNRDFVADANQPIRTAAFVEPGRYDSKQPVSFDLRWLAKPVEAIHRRVKAVNGGSALDEVEIRFEDGHRLVVADRDLAALPPRKAAPDADKDLLRLTFGIGTPDIYASIDERTKEMAEARPNWLFLLGKDGSNADNHKTGVDRVFAWREEGEAGNLHLYLIGYERIAVVAHYCVPLGKS